AFTTPAPLAPSSTVGLSRHYQPWQPQQLPPHQQPASQPFDTSNRPRRTRDHPWARTGSLDSGVEGRGAEERGSIGGSDGGPPSSVSVTRISGTATAAGGASATTPTTPTEGAQEQEGFPITSNNRDDVAIQARTSPLPLPNNAGAREGAAAAAAASSDGEKLSTAPPSSYEGSLEVVEGSGAVEHPELEEG
ncbi:unnamed protein product, partial [Laminaria digitata]